MRHTSVSVVSRSLLISVSAGALLASACGAGPATPPQTAAAAVTPELGGTVTLPDNSAKLEVPAGAVGEATMITVSTTTMSAPAGTTALSPVLKFEPDGLVFTKPVRVTFTFKGGATSPSVYWSNASGGYDALGGMISGTTIAADVTHFSSGFVGEGSPCMEGATCGAGSKCGVGPSGGTSTGGASGGGGSVDGTPSAGADAGAPMTDPGSTSTGIGGSSSGGAAPHAGALTSDGMCCACGADGTYHCGACGAPGADAGAPACAEGVACQPGSGCAFGGGGGSTTGPLWSGGTTATGGATSGGMCCSCGADGVMHCGTSCPGGIDTGPDGGPTGGTGGGSVDAGTNQGTCAPGAACQPGSGCGGGSSGGACIKCMCGADGTMVCSDCGTPPPPSDAGAPPPPPTCAPGAACQPGTGCGGASQGGACIKCMCGADGTLACSDCGAPPPPSDAGAPPPPPTCAPGAACQPGTGCGGASQGGACIKCMCGADGTLACVDCGAPPPPSDAAAPPPPPPVCAPQTDCPDVGAACNTASPDGGCMKCVCGTDHLLACTSCGPAA